MKILIVNARYFITGGPERYMFNIKKELEKLGHEIIPFSIKNKNNVESEYSDYFTSNIVAGDEVFFDQYKPTIKNYFKVIARQIYSKEVERDLSRLIKKTKPDLCYLLHYFNKLSPSVIRACKKNNVPVIHRLSDYYIMCPQAGFFREGKFCDECKKEKFAVIRHKCVRNSLPASLIKYFAYKFHEMTKIYDGVNVFVCTNKFMYQKMIEFGFDKKKLVIIPTFFSKGNWGVEEQKIIKNKAIKDKVRLICAGNFDESKGTYDLLEAIKMLRDENPKMDFELTLVGGLQKKEIDKVNDFVKCNKLEEVVKVYPLIETKKLRKIYIDANVSILPSRWVENMPNVLLESLFFSLPVIVPDFGCFPGLVNDDVSFKYEPYNITSLKDTIKQVISNPKMIEQKSKKCRPYLENNFSQEQHIKKLTELMRGTVKCSK